MSSVTTFGAFTAARLGMAASMKGLDVTGHNIANINTGGYTRQGLDQRSLFLSGTDRYVSRNDARVGSGVLCVGISQIRDPYLDIRYRNEMASVGSMDSKLSGLESLTKILDEVGKADGDGVIEKHFKDLMTQLQALNTNPNASENQTLVRTSAENLIKLINDAATRLESVKEGQEKALKDDLTDVNIILKKIGELNDSIRKSEIHGDQALERRDQRNVLIDQLSQFMKIDVSYRTTDLGDGSSVQDLVIKLGDGGKGALSLVDGKYVTELSVHTDLMKNPVYDATFDPNSQAYNPANDPTDPRAYYYVDEDGTGTNDPIKAAIVQDPDYTLDMAALKDAKGNVLAGSGAETMPDNLSGGLQAIRDMLTGAGEFTDNATAARDPSALTKRGVPYYQKSLDALANQFAKLMNQANPTYLTDKNGYYVTSEGAPILNPDVVNPDPDHPVYLSSADSLSPAQQAAVDAQAEKVGGTLFSNSPTGNSTTGITAKNLSISHAWSTKEIQIAIYAKFEDKATAANANIGHIINVMKGDYAYKPSDIMGADGSDTPFFHGSFQEMYTDMCATLANDKLATTAMLENYASTAEELNIGRDSVSGVDLNDEASNMMMYQKSYAAAARLMTTIDEALDKLINGTGVVGR